MRCLFWLNLLTLASCSADNTIIKIKGSDTEVNLAVQLAESFHSTNPGLFVSISGGGSGLGIASLMNGTADLANSSRSINDLELKLFNKRGINLDSFIFAQDAIAFVVASSLPIDSITPAELGNLLKGSLKNWASLTGKDLPVTIYGRQSNSGTHDFVKKKLGIDFSPHAKEMNGNAQILEALKSDNSGIGYVGAGYVIHGGSKGIKVLTVYETKKNKAVSPLDAAMIAAGKYYFQRPLFQYYKTGSFEKVKPILDFEKSTGGQKIIRDAGYYPVN
jgi:phosphate transport system substrate-binding protein